jgi:DNA polymerase III sliding clamp (beta) subunit (PCNA family)
MQLTCERVQLLNALNELQTIIKPNAQTVATTCVLLSASETELVLTGTNLAATLYLTIPCTAIVPGAALIQHNLLTTWLKFTVGETVKLELKDTKLIVMVGKAKCTLATYPVIDFPDNGTVADALVNDVALALPIELERALRLTAVATLDDAADPRAHLHALTFMFTTNKLSIYATDSFRLALQEIDVTAELNTVFMLPVQGIQTNLLSLLKQIQPDNIIKFYDLPNQVVFQLNCKNYTVILALQKVSGKHININGLIPQGNTIELRATRTELVTALQAAQVFGRNNRDRVYLTIDAATSSMTISSLYNEIGMHENNIEVYGMVGSDQIYLILNAAYLLEYLRVSNAQEILMSKRANDRSPLILRDATQPDQGLYLVMPINDRPV